LEHEVLPTLLIRIFRLGLFQDGDIGVGVFPERQKIFISSERPYASSIRVIAL
jgi:hypothetical protein